MDLHVSDGGGTGPDGGVNVGLLVDGDQDAGEYGCNRVQNCTGALNLKKSWNFPILYTSSLLLVSPFYEMNQESEVRNELNDPPSPFPTPSHDLFVTLRDIRVSIVSPLC